MEKDFRVKNGLIVGSNAYITNSITSVDSVIFDNSAGIADLARGEMAWNEDDNTVDIGINGVTLPIGQKDFILIKNQTGSTIGKGNVVRFAGTVGASGRLLGAKALADGSLPSKYVLGVAAETIINGDDGFVASFGKLRKVDTSMFSDGDILYASPSVSGGLSNTVPAAPNNIVTVAAVVYSDDSNGELFVRPTFGSTLSEDETVHLTGLQSNDALLWNSSTSRFENYAITSSVNDHLNTSTASSGEFLGWSGTDYQWLAPPAAGSNTEVQFNLDGDFSSSASLTFDGSALVVLANVGIGTAAPTEQLDVSGDSIRVRTSQTPASATAAGDVGQICWDSNYVYVCVADNTWKRAALSAW